MLRIFSALWTLSVVTGCAAAVPLSVSDDHPASPSASEGVVPPQSNVLTSDDMDATRSEAIPAGRGGRRNGSEAATATYICPMHPEVQQTQPGQCPKCGMRLIKKRTGADENGATGDAAPSHKGH